MTENCPFNGALRTPAIHLWKPIWVDDLDVKPILIESKSQYKRELKQRGLSCRGLM